jgi:GntR family transcriptional repressor for pyruvate dehydrogenase complex
MLEPSGAVARVATVLLRRIVGDEYSPGLRLPSELDLAAELSCGRSTVREALRHLAGMNLVQSRQGSGAVVLDWRREGTLDLLPAYLQAGRFDQPVPVVVLELLRLRRLLACEAARLASLYASPQSLVPVRRRIEAAEAVRTRPLEHSLHELEIFRALIQASAIWPMVWMSNVIMRAFAAVNRLVAVELDAVRDDWRPTMDALLELVERRDAQGAVALLEEFFERSDADVSRRLAELFARQQ